MPGYVFIKEEREKRNKKHTLVMKTEEVVEEDSDSSFSSYEF